MSLLPCVRQPTPPAIVLGYAKVSATTSLRFDTPVQGMGLRLCDKSQECPSTSQFELYKRAEANLLSHSFARRKIKFDPINEMWYDKAYWQAVNSIAFATAVYECFEKSYGTKIVL